MSDSHDETVTRSVIDQIKTDRTDNSKGKVLKFIHTHEVSEMKEITSKIIDYPRLFLLRVRDHRLSQVNSIRARIQFTGFKAPPVDLPNIQGVTFVQTSDNNNSESMRGDLTFNPGILR